MTTATTKRGIAVAALLLPSVAIRLDTLD